MRLAKALNLEAFVEAERVLLGDLFGIIDDLKHRLLDSLKTWISDNKKRLAGIHSVLPYKVLVQQFIGLVSQGRKLEAIELIRAHNHVIKDLEQEHGDLIAEFHEIMGCLVFCSQSSNLIEFYIQNELQEKLNRGQRQNFENSGKEKQRDSKLQIKISKEVGFNMEIEELNEQEPRVWDAISFYSDEIMMPLNQNFEAHQTASTNGRQAPIFNNKNIVQRSTDNRNGLEGEEITKLGGLSIYKPYLKYFQSDRWNELIELFKIACQVLYQIKFESGLQKIMSMGISAVKTAACVRATSHALVCPICDQNTKELAHQIPHTTKHISTLLCRGTKQLMNESNPPMMLPNGQIFSKSAIENMIARNGGDRIVCPITQTVFDASSVRKVFLF